MPPRPTSHLTATLLTLASSALLTTACSNDSDPVQPPTQALYDSITIDASHGWAALRLGQPASVATPADLGTSADWDIAFNATTVMLNGGEAGPGGVAGFCICQNAQASNDALMHMTPASELDDFTGVTSAQIPTSAQAWRQDSLALVITGWWNYDQATHTVSADPSKVWVLHAASDTPYVKLHITALANATRTSAGTVRLEYAIQPAIGQPMQAPVERDVTVPETGTVYFHFATGTASSDSAEHPWDIAITGYIIRLNGGVSGPGRASAVPAGQSFESLTSVDDIPETAYRTDSFGGVFAESKWYRYNLTGSDHQIWPTYDVYLVRRGSTVYKIQLVGYYSPAGEPRHITIRYAKLAD
jgi:hypothetical protein